MTIAVPNFLQNLVTVEDESLPEPAWGPTGKEVFDRTYSRVKEDGTLETWEDTVRRVVRGNTALVDSKFIADDERERLFDLIYNFKILPAGRHLWMSGVPGRSFLYNCFVSGWTENLSDHFAFTFSQLLQGGGVGANYSNKYLNEYKIQNKIDLKITASKNHRDYAAMEDLLDGEVPEQYFRDTPYSFYAVEDSREGWVECLKAIVDLAANTNPQPYAGRSGLVLDVSFVRPMGEPIRGFGGTASGPAPLVEMLRQVADVINGAVGRSLTSLEAMEIEHAIAGCVVAGNVRRSARMSIKHWADPDIFDFIDCKKSGLSHWSTNISVEIDSEFIRLNRKFTRDYHPLESQARKVYRALVEGMLNNGEPGIWNSTLSNVGEPNTIIATNPCGEICLEGFEPCNLGHVNLDAYVNGDGSVDEKGMAEAHRLMTRFLMRATFGDITDPKTQAVNDRNRRIGVGHFGFAGFLAKQKILFGQASRDDSVWEILLEMSSVVDEEAIAYAHTLRIPVPVKKRTMAPTGTIAKLAGRSEGAHPVYSRYFIRRIRYGMHDPRQAAQVEEFRAKGYNVVKDTYTKDTWVVEIPTKEALVSELEAMGIAPMFLQSQDEIELSDLLDVQAMYQTAWADNAVSFTVNVPKDKYSVEDVMAALLPRLHKLKGTTMMVDESRELAPYERITAGAYYASEIQSEDASYDADCRSGACPVR